MKLWKKIVLAAGLALAGLTLVPGGPVSAQTGATGAAAARTPSKIKVLNLVRAFNALDMKIQGDRDMMDMSRKLDDDRKKLEEELDKLKEELKMYTPGTDSYRDTEEKILRKGMEIATQAQYTEQKLMMEQRLRTVSLYRSLLKSVEDYAKANDVALVLMSDDPDLAAARTSPELQSKITIRKVLYAHESMDITRTIVEKMNADFKAGPASAGK